MHKLIAVLITLSLGQAVFAQYGYKRTIDYTPILTEQFSADSLDLLAVEDPVVGVIFYTYSTIQQLETNYSAKSFEKVLLGFDSIAKTTQNPQTKLRAQLAITAAKSLYSPRSYYTTNTKQQLLLLHQETYYPLLIQYYYTFENVLTYESAKQRIVQSVNPENKATIIFTNGNTQKLDVNKRALKPSEKTAVIILQQEQPFPYTMIFSFQKFTKRAYNQFVQIAEYNNASLRLLKYLHSRNMFNLHRSKHPQLKKDFNAWSITLMNLNAKDNHLVLDKFMTISTEMLQKTGKIKENETLFSVDTDKLQKPEQNYIQAFKKIAFNVNTLNNSGELYQKLLELFTIYVNTWQTTGINPQGKEVSFGRILKVNDVETILTGASMLPKTKKKKGCFTFTIYTSAGTQEMCEDFEELNL